MTKKQNSTNSSPLRPNPRQGAEKGQQADRPRIFIATGASGGHIFPGLAIAHVLRKEGYWCTFIGSARQFSGLIKDRGFDFIPLPATAFTGGGISKKLRSIQFMGKAFLKAVKLIKRHKPVAVLGMGSYASVSTVLAGRLLRVPTLIHEQNAKPGKANLLLARFVPRILLSFDAARKHFPGAEKQENKYTTVGNPVRDEVLALRGLPRPEGKYLDILAVGGSQGARILTDVIPEAISRLPKKLQERIRITQQARPEDLSRLEEAYKGLSLGAIEIQPFFDNLPELMHRAHVVITRSGTGSVSELAVLNRASILVPIRLAHGHQVENAKILSRVGAAVLMEENIFTPEALAKELESILTREGKRTLFEKNTALVAKPQAAEEAAAEVIRISGGEAPTVLDEDDEDIDDETHLLDEEDEVNQDINHDSPKDA